MDAATPDLISRYEKLYSSLVSDAVETAGLGPRAAAPGLQPYHADPLRVVVGPAHTCQVRRTSEHVEIDRLLEMVDATPAHSVSVVATDHDVNGALWGGLMSTGVIARGGVGAVVDGGVRDLHTIMPLGFPVFATYRSPLDIRGRGEIVSHGEPVTFRGVPVAPGDLVFADANGVVVVPLHAVEQVLAICEARIEGELATEDELRGGAGARDVYERHGAF